MPVVNLRRTFVTKVPRAWNMDVTMEKHTVLSSHCVSEKTNAVAFAVECRLSSNSTRNLQQAELKAYNKSATSWNNGVCTLPRCVHGGRQPAAPAGWRGPTVDKSPVSEWTGRSSSHVVVASCSMRTRPGRSVAERPPAASAAYTQSSTHLVSTGKPITGKT